MLDLVRLRVLAAVAAHGSVTGAAQALHYTQPTVSHHLSRLEAATGARLVQKVGRGIRLTPEGQVLARRAAEIIGRVDAADAELAALIGLEVGRVYTSDDITVRQAFVAHGLGVATMPGMALRWHQADGVQATRIGAVRRIYLATYGEPPDPPATAAFVEALKQAAPGRPREDRNRSARSRAARPTAPPGS
ncbi:LysR family transcriptional regulator [Kribbella turkmenica]|uniref:LysR family transcriptional regulator n=1 Tax=Kribbella turkmenica TaxID=2530375 RepID=A0A4R4XBI1_9ACTN|nr:LysR family transcriptional regulator [Kribbella turkmenica]TDD27749.1 LysR family transcriptional regulator [Kribbella turkmenica]